LKRILPRLTETESLQGLFPSGYFCDGLYFPRTKLTNNQQAVDRYFQSVNLKTKKIGRTYQKYVTDATHWFVKLDEDIVISIGDIKSRLLELMKQLRKDLSQAGEDANAFICQFDITQDYKGYFYCSDFG
jgi:hypothetical protein